MTSQDNAFERHIDSNSKALTNGHEIDTILRYEAGPDPRFTGSGGTALGENMSSQACSNRLNCKYFGQRLTFLPSAKRRMKVLFVARPILWSKATIM